MRTVGMRDMQGRFVGFMAIIWYALPLMLIMSQGRALAECLPGAEGDFCRRVKEENARFEKEAMNHKEEMDRDWQERQRQKRLNPESADTSRPGQEIDSEGYTENLIRF